MNQRENISTSTGGWISAEGGVRAVCQDEAREYAGAGGPGFEGPCKLILKPLGLII